MACELFVLPYAGAPLRAPGQSSCLEVVFWKATSEYEAHMRGPANARALVGSRRLRPRHRPHFVEPWTQYLMQDILKSLQYLDDKGSFSDAKNAVLGGLFSLQPDAAAQAALQLE